MGELPALVSDLALILVIAGVVTVIFKRLGQPLVLGYIVAGFLCGPHMGWFPTIGDREDVQVWADIGVIFMMFNLGLEFSFKKIMKLGSSPFIAACSIIFCMMCLGAVAGHFFGWSKINCLFLGGMLAMSSTTIIFKALDDLGLKQQRFAGSVLSVLVIEDILGILLMVLLAMFAAGSHLEGSAFLGSIVKLVVVLVLWFTVGIFLIPTLLRYYRRWISRESLLIISIGLCFLMVVLASKMGYSAAFGAFMMGSILAETIEAEQITDVIGSVKDFFGAIFFVSVGMLVDPQILLDYWGPILILVLIILFGQSILGTLSYLLSGLPLKVAMQCGFSMAQIGEFAFIIAAMGVSLHVTADYLYPIVVAVSVITTFITPYMMRLAVPAYGGLERRLPTKLRVALRHTSSVETVSKENDWRDLFVVMAQIVLLYSVVVIAVIAVMLSGVMPLLAGLLGDKWGHLVCCVLTIALVAPFLNGIVLRRNHSKPFLRLRQNPQNRFPLLFTILARFVYSAVAIFYIIGSTVAVPVLLRVLLAFVLMALILLSGHVGRLNMLFETLFVRNLHSREVRDERRGQRKPAYAERLLERDIHISVLTLPMNTQLAGKTLRELALTRRYDVMVVSILREGQRLNTPGAEARLFPGDKIQVIGGDKQLQRFAQVLQTSVHPALERNDDREMLLRSITITADSPFINKKVSQSRLREDYHCMLIGFEEGDEHLGKASAERVFLQGDVVWVVGERAALRELLAADK